MTDEWQTLLLATGKLAVPIVLGLVLHVVLLRIASAVARRRHVDERVVQSLRGPSRIIIPLLLLSATLPAVPELGLAAQTLLRHLLSVAVIAAFTWLAAALVVTASQVVMGRYDVAHADNLEARRIHTQALVLQRTIIGVIVVLGLGAVLMTFPRIREIGASLLVSAGVAGLAIGLAARPILENLIAGLQLAFTQPIRVDDVVIVEGEWGRVEEITATYVVVRIWDERRLIVPFAHFISQPFQNWTRRTADILGTVLIHADYTVPVQAVREELMRLCAANELWDGRVCNLQVTAAGERTLELRALVSASDAARAWDLRVQLREQLIGYLQQHHPQCLPRMRVLLPGQDGPSDHSGDQADQREGP
ncbi:MAG: mechanosensitive ion channel family protein [Pseudomonadales bacterium]